MGTDVKERLVLDLIIENGLLVTAASTSRADLGIKDGKIVQIGGELADARRRIDAAGKYVIPGGIDVHTHLDAPGAGFNTAAPGFVGLSNGSSIKSSTRSSPASDVCKPAALDASSANGCSKLARYHKNMNRSPTVSASFSAIVPAATAARSLMIRTPA